MAKNLRGRYRKYSKEFRQMAVEQMLQCNNIVRLAEELGTSEVVVPLARTALV